MLIEKVNSNDQLAGQIEASDVASGIVPVMATPTTPGAMASPSVARAVQNIGMAWNAYQANKK